MNAFGPVAEFYDELMGGVPYPMWVSYYLLLLAHQDIHPKRVLDVCCGTGTMCELLTKEGLEMTGFDLSAPMIEIAREKARRSHVPIRYEVADASNFELGEPFDAAFSFFDSLNYITEPEKLAQAMMQISKHLEPGGSFIFDLNTAYAFEAQLFDQENTKPKSKVKYKWHGDWNPETRIIQVHMRFWHGSEQVDEVHVQRAHDDSEVREMLDDACFEDVRAFHSYTLNPPRYKSDRLHYMARKRS